MGINRRVCVGFEINPRYHASGHTKSLSSQWVPIDAYCGFDPGDISNLKFPCSIEERLILETQEGEIAVMGNETNMGNKGMTHSSSGDRDEPRIAHDVGIGQDSLTVNDKSRSDTSLDPSGIPRRAVIGLLHRGLDPHYAGREIGKRLRITRDIIGCLSEQQGSTWQEKDAQNDEKSPEKHWHRTPLSGT